MAATTNPADVRRAAMDLLARREHSVEELRQKLARRFGRDQELDQVIVEQLDRLVDEGLLSDSRFAAAMLRQLVLKVWAPAAWTGNCASGALIRAGSFVRSGGTGHRLV